MIRLEDINKTYYNGAPLHVLKGINLHIERGEFVSIMGASGSGKSTLLNILGILDNYDTGEYYLNGTLIKGLSENRAAEYRNRMIGFIFQSFNLISFKNAVENVALPLFYQGVGRRKRNALALEYLDRLGLKDWAHHMPNEMSGGQKQRVAIARALITRPQIILADEPTGALDSKTSVEVMQIPQGPAPDGHDHRRRHPRKRRGQPDGQDYPHQGRCHRQHRREPAARRVALRPGRIDEVTLL